MSAYQVLRENDDNAQSLRDRDVRLRRNDKPLTQFQLVRRYWWVVLTVTSLALLAAVASTYDVPTTYTGRASLIVSSNNRAPDQDAVLVQGYVDYFNNTAYQSQLAKEAGVSDVSLVARAAAASPILLIESTTPDSDRAQESAAKVAEAFQTDINRVRDADQQQQLRSLQTRLDAARAAGPDAASSVATLQDQIAQIQADRTNRLQELQFRGGVSTNAPSSRTNLVFGLFGGLVLGLLAALAVGRSVEFLRRRRYRDLPD